MKAFLNPWVLLGLVTLLLGSSTLAYWKGGQRMAEHLAAQQLSGQAIAQAAATAVAAQVVDAVAKHKGNTQVITKQAETIVKENTVYRDCKIDDNMQRLIQQAGERDVQQ